MPKTPAQRQADYRQRVGRREQVRAKALNLLWQEALDAHQAGVTHGTLGTLLAGALSEAWLYPEPNRPAAFAEALAGELHKATPRLNM